MIPVLHLRSWHVIRSRLQGACLSYSKRLDLLHDHDVSRITGLCEYSNISPDPLRWTHKMNCPRDVQPINHDICLHCYNTDLRVNPTEGTLICSGCGIIHAENVIQEASYTQSFSVLPSFTRQRQQIPRRHAQSCYKRCNHFREVLLRLQGKEKVHISQQEIDAIRSEIQRRGIDMNELRADTMKLILRSLGFQRYYNHTYYILKDLTGHALVSFTNSQTTQLFKMFMKIQQPFAKHAPKRANMMSYQYIVKKLCEILEWNDVANSLFHLKSKTKVVEEDHIWKKICLSVGFPFYPSVL